MCSNRVLKFDLFCDGAQTCSLSQARCFLSSSWVMLMYLCITFMYWISFHLALTSCVQWGPNALAIHCHSKSKQIGSKYVDLCKDNYFQWTVFPHPKLHLTLSVCKYYHFTTTLNQGGKIRFLCIRYFTVKIVICQI